VTGLLRFVIVGLGNIGSYAADLICRLSFAMELVLIDPDVYDSGNVHAQLIEKRSVGLPKAAAAARRIRGIRPDITVKAIRARVQRVPAGLFLCTAVLGCLDNNRSRMHVASLCWALGTPYIDAGVNPDFLAARVSVFPGTEDGACLECSWSDQDYDALDQTFPCARHHEGSAPPTHSPAALGALAASLQTLRLREMISGAPTERASETVMEAQSGNMFVSTLQRSESCRFSHNRWHPRPIRAGNLQDILDAAGRDGVAGDVTLQVLPQRFDTVMVCPNCRDYRRVLYVSGRQARPRTCRWCGAVMDSSGFHQLEKVRPGDLRPGLLTRPLARAGIRAGDIVRISGDDQLDYVLEDGYER